MSTTSNCEAENYSTSVVENISSPIAIDNESISQRSLATNTLDELVHYPNNNRITYRQDIGVRYLQPPTPPPSGPVIIRELHAPQPPEPAPLIIHQRHPAPLTPPPVVLRERPPVPPPIEPPQIIHKYLPAPPPPPQKVIIEREAPLPRKPPPIIIEKWLPYKSRPQREVIIERAEPLPPRSLQKNTIIAYDPPAIDLVRSVRHLGTVRVDPDIYKKQYETHLVTSEYIQDAMSRLGIENTYLTISTKPNSPISNNNQFQTISQQSNIHEGTEIVTEEFYDSTLNDLNQTEILSDENIYDEDTN